MLFTCRPPGFAKSGTPIPGHFPGPAHARGKWFTLDIHCHIRSAKATEMVEGNEAVARWYLETQASPQSREINRQKVRSQSDFDRLTKDVKEGDRLTLLLQRGPMSLYVAFTAGGKG